MQDSAGPAGAEEIFPPVWRGVCVTACLTLSVEWVLHARAQFIMDLGQLLVDGKGKPSCEHKALY